MAFVIVGASLAGISAAAALREQGYSGDLILLGAEKEPPYERPPLSKGYLLGDAERSSVFVQPSSWYEENAVDLRMGAEVVAVDPAAHTVTLASGEQVGYTKLLLATGCAPRQLPVPGADQPHVRYLRTLADSEALRADLRAGVQVAVIGAGWIGLEVAAAARHHGADVTIVETDSLPLRRVLGDEVAAVFRDLHQAHDVKFHFGRSVQSIGPDAVTLDDGTSVPADLVVVGIGVAPRTDLASGAGLRRRQRRARLRDAADLRRRHLRLRRHRQLGASPYRATDPRWSTGRTPARAASSPRGPCSASPVSTTGCPTSSPTSTTWAWSTPATPRRGRLRPGGLPRRRRRA